MVKSQSEQTGLHLPIQGYIRCDLSLYRSEDHSRYILYMGYNLMVVKKHFYYVTNLSDVWSPSAPSLKYKKSVQLTTGVLAAFLCMLVM